MHDSPSPFQVSLGPARYLPCIHVAVFSTGDGAGMVCIVQGLEAVVNWLDGCMPLPTF